MSQKTRSNFGVIILVEKEAPKPKSRSRIHAIAGTCKNKKFLIRKHDSRVVGIGAFNFLLNEAFVGYLQLLARNSRTSNTCPETNIEYTFDSGSIICNYITHFHRTKYDLQPTFLRTIFL